MADDLVKKILSAPDLPNTIQGDGRYLISLLRKYLKSANDQINVANGFTADDIDASSKGDYTTPKNFTLTFDRIGGILNWDAIVDDSNLGYYETRTDSNVGDYTGRLEKTTSTSSTVLPITSTGKIYLFAVNKNGEASNATSITYNKARPYAPADIALTKNNEGTLITFLEIPTNCIGANIYIDGIKYQTVDNMYLYAGTGIKEIIIAYYDQFGEGERSTFSCYVPNVTGFWVEKNDANLYLYWDAVNIYNVKYVVKVGQTHEWEQGIEILTTRLNKQRYIRPNPGDYYYMIKAADTHNNYSTDCTWYKLTSTNEINKNVVLDFDQESSGYSGTKINTYLDSDLGGLRLEQTSFNGEYIMNISLPQKIKARNWIDAKINSVTNKSIRVCDANFAVDSYDAEHLLVVGTIGDLNGVEMRKQIARYTGNVSDYMFTAISDGTTAASGGTILESVNTSAKPCRWNNGILITDLTKLSYTVSVHAVFSLCFWLKITSGLPQCTILELIGDNTLYVGYDEITKKIYLRDTVNAQSLELSPTFSERDWLFIGISQSSDTRAFFVYTFSYDKTVTCSDSVPSCGPFTSLYLYPKEI